MNQILSIEVPQNKKRRTNNKSSIHSILIVFAMMLMIFGIGLVITGAYSYYKNVSNNLDKNIVASSNTKPSIAAVIENTSTIDLVVTHDKAISNITYKINDDEPVKIDGDNRTEIEEKIELPSGDVQLKIVAEDINGISSSYEKLFEVEQKPKIILEPSEGKIQATVESQINIDYIEYYWDDNKSEAQKYTINDLKTKTLINVLEGTHTLNMIAVDVEGKQAIKTQKVTGAHKPEVEVTTDGKVFNIDAKDSQELEKIEIKLNSNEVITEEINGKEYHTTVNLENGENKITVTVYNKSQLSETSRVKYTKE